MLLLRHFSSNRPPMSDAAVAATHRVPEESPVELKLHVLLQEAGVPSRVPGQFLQGETHVNDSMTVTTALREGNYTE